MKQLIEDFPSQLNNALEIAIKANLTPSQETIQHVLISGLGGSGIGGTIASRLIENKSRIPVAVNKKYAIPAFVSRNTLVIISSYSGNTEETVAALKEALVREAKVVCITSGGEIASVAENSGLDLIRIPGGMPPRACLGYSLVQVLHVLKYYGITPHDFLTEIPDAIALIKEEQQKIRVEARLTAEKLYNKIPVIYCDDDLEGVAIRFRQQLNENSKVLAWHHVFPEMNHNELVGWRNKHQDIAVVFLRNETDHERNKVRMEISKKIFQKYTDTFLEIHSLGKNTLERTLFLINLCDWTSWYLSELNEVDATEVKVIDHLKAELARL